MASANSDGNGAEYSNLDWARAYQRTGLVLLPLWPGIKMHHSSRKHPETALLGAGFKMSEVAECSEAWVERCWGGGDPRGVARNGIGIVCGSRSRLLVVDIDTKNQGEWAWETWRIEREQQGKVLPPGPLVRTPSGGFHLWFKLPEGRVIQLQDKWLDGVDIAGDGKWVAAPPTYISEHRKVYEFMRSGETPMAPEWFLEEVSVRSRVHRPAWASGGGVGDEEGRFVWGTVLSSPIQPGAQQSTLFRAAASARSRGWDDETALKNLRQVVANFIEDPERDPWTDEHVVEAWERVKREYADGDGVDGELDEEVPEYTPWNESEEAAAEESGRPQLRIIQGEGQGVDVEDEDEAEEVVLREVEGGGGDEPGGAEPGGAGPGGANLPPGGGWETPPSLGNTDEEHAREFHRLYGEQILWVPGLEWHSWTGTHWRPDDAHDVDNLLTHLGYRIETYRDVLRSTGDFETEVTALGRRVDKLWNARSVGGVKTKVEPYAQIWDGAVQTAGALDTRPDVINTPTTTLELRGIELGLRSHNQHDLITRCTAVGYVPGARSELLDRYRQTFMPEADHWEALWRLVGSCLVGGNVNRQLVFFVGESTTGKSLLTQLIMKALGNYAALSTPSIFRGNQDERPRADLMNIMSSRVVFIEEVGHAWELHADRVKDITGGGQVTARKLHSNHYVTRDIEFTVIAVTNGLPRIKDADAALLRRVKIVPFQRSVIDREDPVVREHMLNDEATLQAVLAEIVDGARRSRQRGVDDVPVAFNVARAEAYGEISGTEYIVEFVNGLRTKGFLIEDPNAAQKDWVLLKELFELYVTSPGYSRERETKELNVRRFGQLVRMSGFAVDTTNSSRLAGLRLNGSLSLVKAQLGL